MLITPAAAIPKTFTIDQASSTTLVVCAAGPFVYDGSAFTPCTASVTGAGGLSETLTVSYTDNVNAGTVTASASFAGDSNHTGSSDSENFTIDQAASVTVVSCTSGPFVYDGSAFTPCTASVTGAGGLSETLSVSYTDNVNAGIVTASASFAGDSNHTGSSDTETFTIDQASSTTLVICAAGPFVYDGTAFTPCNASVTGAGGLSETLSVSYTDNINAGTVTASASFGGDSNHTGSSDTETFTIDQASSTTLVICAAGPFVYDGFAFTPCTASVTGAGGLSETLSVSYTDNVNAGTVTASASFGGDSNHTGSSDTETFTIDQAASTTTVSCPANVTYTGSALTPCTVSVTGAGGLNLTPAATYLNNTNAGTASASYTFAGDTNHTGSSDSENFTIDQAASITTVSCPANVTYTGSALTPCTVSVTGAGGLNLTPAATYLNNTDAGTASASYTYAGDANHTGSSDTKNFTIDPAASTTTVTCTAGPFIYNASAQTPCTANVTGAGGLNQSLTVSYINNINAGTATASASYAGDANHLASSDSENFTIQKAPSTTTVTCPASVYFTGTPQTPCSAVVTGVGGLNQSLTVTYANNTAVGTATASASYAGDANHLASGDSKNFTILGWTLQGFYQPVDMNGVYNTVRGGSTVPLKFEVFSGTTELTDVAIVESLTYTQFVCSAAISTDEIEIVATGGTVLRYDGGQFIYNWKTPSNIAGKCVRLTVKMDDGSSLIAFFKMK